MNRLWWEEQIRLPAYWLRRALDLVDAVPVSVARGSEWRFKDREGRVHAVHTRIIDSAHTHREALLVRRSSFEKVLAGREQSIVWGGLLHRTPASSLGEEGRPLVYRDLRWLGFMTGDRLEIVMLDDRLEAPGPPAEPPPPPRTPVDSAPVVSIGPTNPDLAVPLSDERLDQDDPIPYFLWDDPIPAGELRRRLAKDPPHERDRLLGKILREARDTDVWYFTTPAEVARRFSALARHLGRRRRFWEFLLTRWYKEGLLAEKPA